MNAAAPRRVEELLATRATEGLGARDARELDELLQREPGIDPESFDRAAAALELAFAGPPPELPEALRLRIVGDSRRHVDVADAPATTADVRPFRPRETASIRGGWLAAAACLALAIAGWWPRSPAETPQPQSAVATPEALAARLAESDTTLTALWQATEDPFSGAAGGDVVWSGERQEGYMRIRGLAPNDPAEAQYQLWIFDRAGDERYPVDGGVFDIPAGAGEVLVPIDAKIAVEEPYLFAVTVERPGGVVVSSRERIVLLAEA